MKFFRKTWAKHFAITLALILFGQLVPPQVWALTGGPSTPEVSSFAQVGTNNLVDPFTGNFSYSIPLLEIDGYPLVLGYNSGVTMDQEASWVGLGWNLQPGSISRQVRGLPDDFDGDLGDKITKTLNTRPNRTFEVNGSISPKDEVIGFDAFGIKYVPSDRDAGLGNEGGAINWSYGIGASFNTYNGIGLSQSFAPTLSVSKTASSGNYNTGSFSLSLKNDSHKGLAITPRVSFSQTNDRKQKKDRPYSNSIDYGVSSTFNSRAGLQSLAFSATSSSNDVVFQGSNGPGVLSFALPTYTPTGELPFKNSSVSVSGKFGATLWATEFWATLSGAYAGQELKYNTLSSPAYGYFNAEKGVQNSKAVMDFNREKDGTYTPNTPSLPVTNFTYDLYTINGHGVNGMFRPQRGDVGYVFDASVLNTNDSYNLGSEFGGGSTAKFGLDFAITDVNSKTGKWTQRNGLASQTNFEAMPNLFKEDPIPSFEKIYFKQTGELSKETDPEFFASIGGFDPVRPEFESPRGFQVPLSNHWNAPSDDKIPNEKRAAREYRNSAISMLTLSEAEQYGTDRNLYSSETENCDNCISVSEKNGHHIGEITVLKPGGSRYIFGLPAYNSLKEEVSFAIGDGPGDDDNENLITPDEDELITYSPGVDNSIDNRHGLDRYYNKVSTPGYAYAYHLTSILSHDYIDNDHVEGPTPGDLGSYHKFNYDRLTQNTDGSYAPYKWRAPVGENKATPNPGISSSDTDDKASYVYGEKEIWQLESIETKDYIAIFETSDRKDGFGVANENGAVDFSGKALQQLDAIKLYNRLDYVRKTANAEVPVPLKTVHFEYSNRLCGDVPNNSESTGKLTLDKVWFSFQDSHKGEGNGYEFFYEGSNEDYHSRSYDRWGFYKPIPSDNYQELSEFPYVPQHPDDATGVLNNLTSWDLTSITTPSQGTISIDYEPDQYGYVQDKRAMQMFKVAGFSENTGEAPTNNLYEWNLINNKEYYWLHLDISQSPILDREDFYSRYLGEGPDHIKDLMFRFKVRLQNSAVGDNQYELVPGYCHLDKPSTSNDLSTYIDLYDAVVVDGVTQYNSVAIKLKGVKLGDSGWAADVNPITKAAMQFALLQNPKIAFDQPNIADGVGEQVFKAILQQAAVATELNHPYRNMYDENMCQTFLPNRSYVRLYHPTKAKLGGGTRVKKITISNNASAMGMGADAVYGQEYAYVNEDGSCSGVAAYEPFIGGDENPWRQPLAFKTNREQRLLAPDDRNFMEEPFGESFFPGPSVGYSRVVMKSIGINGDTYLNDDGDEIVYGKHGTGTTVSEFYTAKDFPTIVKRTDLFPRNKKSPWVFQLLKISSKEFVNVSQGYVIETNNMHGKPKGTWVYQQGTENLVSGAKYEYLLDEDGTLVNEVPTVNKYGNVGNGTVGVDYDIVSDFRESSSDVTNVGLNGNLATFFLTIFPGIVPSVFPAYSREKTRFRSAVTTKVINRAGILKEITAYDNASSITTENSVFDPVTGQVLQTVVENEYGDNIHQFEQPAYWAYDGMGPAASNIGMEFKCTFDLDGKYYLSEEEAELFAGGEEVMITYNELFENAPADSKVHDDAQYKFWVIKNPEPEDGAGDCDCIMLRGGNPLGHCALRVVGTTHFKVVRSGRRNLQSTPIASYTSLENPLATGSLTLTQENKILSTSAAEFKDRWPYTCLSTFVDVSAKFREWNPYFPGEKGIYRPYRSFAYNTDLTDETPGTVKTKNSGYFETFTPLWTLTPGDRFWKPTNAGDPKWIAAETVTRYDLFSGAAIESRNALDIPNHLMLRFNKSLPAAVSSNVESYDLISEGFEEYGNDGALLSSSDKRFNTFEEVNDEGEPTGNLNITDEDAHTGKTALKVESGNSAALLLGSGCVDVVEE